MKLCFYTNSKPKNNVCMIVRNNIARLGTFEPVHKDDLKLYVKRFPIHWIEA